MKQLSQSDSVPAYFEEFQTICSKLGELGLNPKEYDSFNTLQWHMSVFRMHCEDKEFFDAANLLNNGFPQAINTLKLEINKQHANPGSVIKILDNFSPQLEQMQKSINILLQERQNSRDTKKNKPGFKP